MPVPAEVRDLPVIGALDELGRALADRADGYPAAAVLVAPPGAGKTTVVPLWMLDAPWLAGRRIVVLEPRRLAARAAARRLAALLGEDVGETVGYQTRDERRIGPRTRVEVLTEGVLTRRIQHDPELPGVAAVLFDEVHERNVPTDLGLAFALDVRSTLRPDLRIVAMSATPDTERFATLLGGPTPAPVVSSAGRQYPVDIRWRPIPRHPARRAPRVDEAVADTVLAAVRDEPGDVLVFLPGIGEIRRVERLLEGRLPDGVDIRPLAGALTLAEQDLALAPSPSGRRRVVLSTDIAESSLTVDGIRVVVDAGLARVPRFDPRTGMTRLVTVTSSRASADQRAGRAGRLGPGVCYRVWSALEQSTRLAHLPAEITQVDLAGVVLELAAWGTPAEQLAFADRPPRAALETAQRLLVDLGALDTAGAITATGRQVLSLPVHPRLARMIVDAPPADRPLACAVAALLDERDILRGRPDDLPSDLALRVAVLAGAHGDERADRRAVDQVRRRADDLARRAGTSLDLDVLDPARTGAVLGLAHPDRLAIRRATRGQRGQFRLRTGTGAWVPPDDGLAEEEFVVAADLDGNRSAARIRLGAALDADDLATVLGDALERGDHLVWDRQRDDLVLRTEWRLGGTVLRESTRTPDPGPATVAALVERVTATRLGALDMAAAAELRARISVLQRLAAEPTGTPAAFRSLGDLPDLSDRALLARLDEWLVPFLGSATSRADLQRFDVTMALHSLLSWDQQMALADAAPPTYTTPAGRTAPIDYTRDRPTVSVRVQDMFGCTTHPTVASGQVPLTLELLSPADRPLQVTADLPSFWAGSWAEVRKEMAGRYPKHHWPLDPTQAPPRRMKDR